MAYRDENGLEIADHQFVKEVIKTYRTMYSEVCKLANEHPNDVVVGLAFTKSATSLLTPSARKSAVSPVSFFFFDNACSAAALACLLTDKVNESHAAENALYLVMHYCIAGIRSTAADRETPFFLAQAKKRDDAALVFNNALQAYLAL